MRREKKWWEDRSVNIRRGKKKIEETSSESKGN